MTSIGKALVVLIAVLSLFMLTISVSALVARQDWKAELAKVGDQIKETKDETAKIASDLAGRQAALDRAKNDLTAVKKSQEEKINAVDSETAKLSRDNETARATLFDLRKKAEAALAESKNLAGQIGTLRSQVAALRDQEKKFNDQNQTLDDAIVNVRRDAEVAKTHQGDISGSTGSAVAGSPAPALNSGGQ